MDDVYDINDGIETRDTMKRRKLNSLYLSRVEKRGSAGDGKQFSFYAHDVIPKLSNRFLLCL